MTIPENFVKQS